jgi:hypothetical protein
VNWVNRYEELEMLRGEIERIAKSGTITKAIK